MHFKIVRFLFGNQRNEILNLISLSVGIASFLIIIAFLYNESNYDTFHEHSENIYRITANGEISNQNIAYASVAAPVAHALKRDFPEINSSIRIRKFGDVLVGNKHDVINETNVLYADSNFFEFFNFEIIHGKPSDVLSQPYQLVLTETSAQKYFGTTQVIGKSLYFKSEDKNYIISGVAADPPINSHFHFDMVASMLSKDHAKNNMWLRHSYYTYIRLDPHANISEMENKINANLPLYMGPMIEKILGISFNEYMSNGNQYYYKLQPIRSIHLYSNLELELEPGGNIQLNSVLWIIACFIFLMSVINYINLSLTIFIQRTKEIGVRKTLGASSFTLSAQLITESVVKVFLNVIFALLLAYVFIAIISPFMGMNIPVGKIHTHNIAITLLVIFIILVILFSFVPVFRAIRLKATHALQNKGGANKHALRLKQVFAIIQIGLAFFTITATLVVYSQTHFLSHSEPGFKTNNVFIIPNIKSLGNRYLSFKKELELNHEIKSVSSSVHHFGLDFLERSFYLKGAKNNEPYMMWETWVNYDYCESYKLRLQSGRFFSPKFASDSNAVIINKKAAQILGLKEPVGEQLVIKGKTSAEDDYYTIIGVIDDVYFQGMKTELAPMVFQFMRGFWDGYASVHYIPGQNNTCLEIVKSKWEEFSDESFMEYFLLDEFYSNIYSEEKKASLLLILFSILSGIIAISGAFGLITYQLKTNQKVIAIKKIHGATSNGLYLEYLNRFLIIIFIACVLAILPLQLFLKNWLQDYPFRIKLSSIYYIIGFMALSIISLAAVSFTVFNTIRKNPVKFIQYE